MDITKEKLLIFFAELMNNNPHEKGKHGHVVEVKICRLPFKRDSRFLNCLGENVCLATAPKYFS